MKSQITVSLCLALLFVATVQAQSSPDRDAWGYLGGAVGSAFHEGESASFFRVQGGGEGIFAGGLGAAAEVGYQAFFEASGDGVGVFSVGPSYHFNPDKKVDPFVTGGYTLFFRSGTANGFYFGGGVDWWPRERMGLRLEGRDEVMEGEVHFVSFRVNLLLF